MGNRTFSLVENEFYHIYNRGPDKRVTFLDSADYCRFIEMMYLANTSQSVNLRDIKKHLKDVFVYERPDSIVSIGAYCLMPNHFHILITPVIDQGVSLFMNKLTTSYTMYFNKRYERTGSLFQGVFKAQHADSDEYLKYLYAYIHLNPVKLIDKDWKERGSKDAAKSFDFAASYTYSSLPDYLGVGRPEHKIINPVPFPNYFANTADHRTELFDWLTYAEALSLGRPSGRAPLDKK